METQHRLIPGYRELSQAETDTIAKLKQQGNELGATLDSIEQMPGIDQRALSIARTNLQTGQMWLIRSITKPEGF